MSSELFEGEDKLSPYIGQTSVMRRLRRPLFWLPLVVLSTFFAAFGWRNWHIFMENDETLNENVIIAASNYTLSQIPQDAIAQVRWKDALSSTRVQNVIREHHPRIHVLSQAEDFPERATYIDAIEFNEDDVESRYRAGCFVSWDGVSTWGLRLTRSPFKFWDNSWHVTAVVKQEGDFYQLP